MSHFTSRKISVILPAYNEGDLIFASVRETARALDGCDYEIIVVDDGSSDCTAAEARRAAAQNARVRVVSYPCNMGKGYALRHGFCCCNGELIAFLDSDLDLHPCQLQTLYQIMIETGADVVIGSKQHPDSHLNYPWHRKLFSTTYYGLISALFGLHIHDTQTGIKLFRHAVLVDAFPRVQSLGYTYDLELLVAAMRFGYQIAEAPIRLTYQRQSPGRIGVRSIFIMWLDTLRIFYRASFWKWLAPANTTKLWIGASVLGLVAASFGIANALVFLDVPPWLSAVTYYLTLHSLPRIWRNLLLVVGGLGLLSVALIQLNKSIVNAFARSDCGDLSGILNAPSRSVPEQSVGVNRPAQSSDHQP